MRQICEFKKNSVYREDYKVCKVKRAKTLEVLKSDKKKKTAKNYGILTIFKFCQYILHMYYLISPNLAEQCMILSPAFSSLNKKL